MSALGALHGQWSGTTAKRVALACGAGVLFFGITIQLVFETPRWLGVAKDSNHLANLPHSLTGWSMCDLPLGPTEQVARRIAHILDCDYFVYREFRQQDHAVTLYSAYWKLGRMSTQLVASHTPDRCWTENGWTCLEQRHAVRVGSLTRWLPPGEERFFLAPDGRRVHVCFWHLVGGELYDYGERFNAVPSVWRWWRDAARQIVRAPPEQYFVRLTSDRAFEELRGDPGWEDLLIALGKLGLTERVEK